MPILRTITFSFALIIVLQVVLFATRGWKPLSKSIADCANYPMGSVLFDVRNDLSELPRDYEATLPDNEGAVSVIVGDFDPAGTVDLNSAIEMALNPQHGRVYEGYDGDTPAYEVEAGSVGFRWEGQRSRSTESTLQCSDCPYAIAKMTLIQRTWQQIYLNWNSEDPHHHITTEAKDPTDNLLDQTMSIVANLVSGEHHILAVQLAYDEGEDVYWFLGIAVAGSDEEEPTQASVTYRQRDWSFSTGNWEDEVLINPENLGSGNTTVPYDGVFWFQNGSPDGVFDSYDTNGTDMDFDMRVESAYSTMLDFDLYCPFTELNHGIDVTTHVELKVTDKAYQSGESNPQYKSQITCLTEYGSIMFVWQVDVMRNCDTTLTNCPCTRHADNDPADPSTP